jgi:5-dehydro-2-deoxygluconokinase
MQDTQNINENIGYEKNLFVLPFDHRAGFAKKLFGFDEPYSAEAIEKVADCKDIIYQAIWRAIELGVPKDSSAILVDEIFGEEVLEDASKKDMIILQTTEKSGQDELALEYGDDYISHLKKFNATFAKVLVRYNVEGDELVNARQRILLKKMSDELHAEGIKLLIEPLIPATVQQLAKVGGDALRFDKELRPLLCSDMISDLQDSGVECDVWKIEGFYAKHDYELVCSQARNKDHRKNVGVIILGRNETKEHVMSWINAGRDVDGVIGFAVGRTIFWDFIVNYKEGKITREECVEGIANEYFEYYQVFRGR